eukprot:Phypoly_transcript_03238.p1 GENE.Phypoly_transcript_03238~~Phypoly_transcript_03238.p1  ORF type:complete len:508 (-),score=91.73 Phypoly_transcript_03238:83-1606(-)
MRLLRYTTQPLSLWLRPPLVTWSASYPQHTIYRCQTTSTTPKTRRGRSKQAATAPETHSTTNPATQPTNPQTTNPPQSTSSSSAQEISEPAIPPPTLPAISIPSPLIPSIPEPLLDTLSSAPAITITSTTTSTVSITTTPPPSPVELNITASDYLITPPSNKFQERLDEKGAEELNEKVKYNCDRHLLAQIDSIIRNLRPYEHRMLSRSSIEALAQELPPFPHELDIGTYPYASNSHMFCARDRGQPVTVLNLLHAMCSSNWTPEEAARVLHKAGHPQNLGPYLPLLRVFKTETYHLDITIWMYEVMKLLKLQMSPHVYALVMRAHIRANAPILAVNFFKEMHSRGQAGIEPYPALFKALRMIGDLHQAREWFYVLAKEHGNKPMHITLCEEIISLFAAFGDTEGAFMTYETMLREGVSMNKKVFHDVISLCKTPELLPLAFRVLEDMKREPNPEMRPDEHTYAVLINTCKAARDVEAEALMKDQKYLLQKELLERKIIANNRNSRY